MTIAKISSTLLRASPCRPYDHCRSYDQCSPQPDPTFHRVQKYSLPTGTLLASPPNAIHVPKNLFFRSRSEHLSGGVASTPFNSARKRLAIAQAPGDTGKTWIE